MGNLDNQPLQQRLQAMLVSINEIVLDKPAVVKLAVACLLANGHLLLQDLPGMGKTTLAHAIPTIWGYRLIGCNLPVICYLPIF